MTKRFSGSINQCRAWLRRCGLDCLHTGWEGNGRIGALVYAGEGKWAAACWPK